MKNIQIVAIDQVLALIDPETFEQFFEPYELTMIFANAAARAEVKKQGLDSSEEKCSTFLNEWLSQLGELGWNITDASRSSVQSTSGHEKTTTLAKKISEILPKDNSLNQFFKTIESPSLQQDVSDLLSFWWEMATSDFPWLALTIASLSLDSQNQLRLNAWSFYQNMSTLKRPKPLLGAAEKFDGSQWDSLFIPIIPSSVSLHSKSISAVLQMDKYSQEKDAIKAKLAGKEAAHYRTAVLAVSS